MKRLKQDKKGFSLLELMIALALLGLVIGGIYSFFFFTQTSFNNVDRQTRILQELNLAADSIGKDIRSAAKPNTVTNAVYLPSAGKGQSIYIYSNTGNGSTVTYRCTGYRLLPADKSKLQKAYYETTKAPSKTAVNPMASSITEAMWATIVNGVIYLDSSKKDVAVFTDTTGSATTERRKIKVDLSVNDTQKPLPSPISVSFTYTSRSKDTVNK